MSDSVHTFADITRESLDREDIVAYSIKTAVGLSEEVVRAISTSFAEPQWMLDIRLASLAKYRELAMPTW
jgi:Fe-S cluster assembly protein SufB